MTIDPRDQVTVTLSLDDALDLTQLLLERPNMETWSNRTYDALRDGIRANTADREASVKVA